ncbi:MAG: Type 1 glutamine amidotransferase-like domain-containing protein [bacterium]|nr:Type 1 glutamine amidotransferase-like domain-containing protein [bacterium]
MQTKFILHGGFTPGQKQENDNFFKEILRSAPEKVKVLLVYFAKEIDRIPTNKDEDIEQFNKNKGQKNLLFEVANEESFLKQVYWADIVYLHGGTSLKLLDTLKQFQNLKQLFEGKIIAGDSAGANILSAVFYSMVADDVFKGFGLIPIKIICHYSEKYKDKLGKDTSSLETLFLPEYHYKTFYIE